jgi:hypothetical protein
LQLEKGKREKLQIINENKEIIKYNATLIRQIFQINRKKGKKTEDYMIERAKRYLEEEESYNIF